MPGKNQAPVNDLASLKSLGLAFDQGGGDYFLSDDEKQDILDADPPIRFNITAIDFEPTAKYGARYVLSVVPTDKPDAPERGWSFAESPNPDTHPRPRTIAAYQKRAATLELLTAVMMSESNEGKPIGPINFVERGRWRTIVDASAEAPEAPDELGI